MFWNIWVPNKPGDNLARFELKKPLSLEAPSSERETCQVRLWGKLPSALGGYESSLWPVLLSCPRPAGS